MLFVSFLRRGDGKAQMVDRQQSDSKTPPVLFVEKGGLYLIFCIYIWLIYEPPDLPTKSKEEGQRSFVTHTSFVLAAHVGFCVNPLSAPIHCILFKSNAFISPSPPSI